MADRLKVAIEAARLGAKVGLKYFAKNLHYKIKSDNSPVTKADVESEEVIKKYILSYFPNDKFIGEESGGSLNQKEFWLVDPLDSTYNFIRQIPFWSVYIAFVKNKEVVIGVSFIPLLDELLFAEKDKGAFKNNNQKIHVSKISEVKNSYFNHSTLYKTVDKLPGFINLGRKAFKMRGFGDNLGFHLVATGKTEGMIDADNEPWDIAAIKLIIEEAGGKLTNFNGEDWTFKNHDIIATNGLVHDEVLRIIHNDK